MNEMHMISSRSFSKKLVFRVSGIVAFCNRLPTIGIPFFHTRCNLERGLLFALITVLWCMAKLVRLCPPDPLHLGFPLMVVFEVLFPSPNTGCVAILACLHHIHLILRVALVVNVIFI